MPAMEEIPRYRTLKAALEVEKPLSVTIETGNLTYSPQYSDGNHVYRHIKMEKNVHRSFNRLLATTRADADGKKLLTVSQFGSIGIRMSEDWEHYMTMERDMIVCFRRNRRGIRDVDGRLLEEQS